MKGIQLKGFTVYSVFKTTHSVEIFFFFFFDRVLWSLDLDAYFEKSSLSVHSQLRLNALSDFWYARS